MGKWKLQEQRVLVLGCYACALLAARLLCTGRSSLSYVGVTRGSPAHSSSFAPQSVTSSQMNRIARQAAAPKFKINTEIDYTEVRLVGEMNEDGEMEEMNEVVSIGEAKSRAKDRGYDLILVNEDQDPPLVRIANSQKYAYEEKKRLNKRDKETKVPRLKVVKLSYTTGDHDIHAKVRNMEKWMQNPRQQVKVQIVMKGRAKMFEQQGKDMLQRVREEAVAFAKITGAGAGGQISYSKDGRGDLSMTMIPGSDINLLKELKSSGRFDMAAEVDEDQVEEEEDEDDNTDGDPLKKELASLEKEIQETRQELLDCGIPARNIRTEPEMIELTEKRDELLKKISQ